MKKIKSIFLIGMLFLVTVGFSQNVREKVEKTYLSQVNVREATGHNDGFEVAAYLKSTDLPVGNAWCAAFVNWTYVQNQVATPQAAAWSPSWFPDNRVCYDIKTGGTTPQKGDVFGIYYSNKNRIAHVGFVHKWPPNENYCITVEGNTNMEGSREGDGVYCKRRLKRQVYKTANWIGYQSSVGSPQSAVGSSQNKYHLTC